LSSELAGERIAWKLGWMEASEIQMERADKKTREARRADKSGEASDAFGRPRPSISEEKMLVRKTLIIFLAEMLYKLRFYESFTLSTPSNI
jgi:hypothetical protein